MSRFEENLVPKIRECLMRGEHVTAITEEFGVSPSFVARVRAGMSFPERREEPIRPPSYYEPLYKKC